MEFPPKAPDSFKMLRGNACQSKYKNRWRLKGTQGGSRFPRAFSANSTWSPKAADHSGTPAGVKRLRLTGAGQKDHPADSDGARGPGRITAARLRSVHSKVTGLEHLEQEAGPQL